MNKIINALSKFEQAFEQAFGMDIFFYIAITTLFVSFASLIAGGFGVSWGHSVSGISLLVFFNAMIFSHH